LHSLKLKKLTSVTEQRNHSYDQHGVCDSTTAGSGGVFWLFWQKTPDDDVSNKQATISMENEMVERYNQMPGQLFPGVAYILLYLIECDLLYTK